MVTQEFDQLVTHRKGDTLHNIKIQDCRDPTNFGALEDFRKQLYGFLVNLSRHRDDPVISLRKKLENRVDAASNCVNRVKAILDVSEPNLITLKCLNDELNDLYKFYSQQSSFFK